MTSRMEEWRMGDGVAEGGESMVTEGGASADPDSLKTVNELFRIVLRNESSARLIAYRTRRTNAANVLFLIAMLLNTR